MKDKELLDLSLYYAEKSGIEEKYIVEYIHSSCIMNKEQALEEYEHANMKCCDTVRLYKVNSVDDVELIEEKN